MIRETRLYAVALMTLWAGAARAESPNPIHADLQVDCGATRYTIGVTGRAATCKIVSQDLAICVDDAIDNLAILDCHRGCLHTTGTGTCHEVNRSSRPARRYYAIETDPDGHRRLRCLRQRGCYFRILVPGEKDREIELVANQYFELPDLAEFQIRKDPK